MAASKWDEKITFGSWKQLNIEETLPSTRYNHLAGVYLSILAWSLHFATIFPSLPLPLLLSRYSQACALCGDTVYLFGGASNNVNGITTYHKELYAFNCKALVGCGMLM